MKEKKPINIEIGQNIKQSRESAGLTQEAFAEMVGLGVKHISAIECGAVGVSLTTLKRICGALSVSSDTLLFGASLSAEQDARSADMHVLASRLTCLSPGEFKAVKELLDKALEAMAIAKGVQ